jgi:hypothetical protein
MLAAASAAAASPAISEPGFSVSILNAGRFIFMLRIAPERVIRSRIAYLRLKHALGRMSLHDPIGAPSNYIE